MKTWPTLLLLAFISLILINCTKQQSEKSNSDSMDHTLTSVEETYSAPSIDSLHTILLTCLLNKDKKTYISYCFTEEQEENLAKLIIDKKKQKNFQREFGFSIHEEVMYFESIVNYLEKNNINLQAIDKSLIETIDYQKANYDPIELKEVIIPIIQEGIERDIVYVAVQIDGRWYFTSELSL